MYNDPTKERTTCKTVKITLEGEVCVDYSPAGSLEDVIEDIIEEVNLNCNIPNFNISSITVDA